MTYTIAGIVRIIYFDYFISISAISLINGSLSSFVIRYEESKIWIVDDLKNQLIEIDIEPKRDLNDQNKINHRYLLRIHLNQKIRL